MEDLKGEEQFDSGLANPSGDLERGQDERAVASPRTLGQAALDVRSPTSP